jgi:hypothetical protein
MRSPEVPAGRIAIAAATIAGTVVGAVAVVLLWLHARGLPPGGQRLSRPYTLVVPGPALQSAPQPDLAAYRAEKARRLQARGWVDAGHGIVHITIDDAMALMAARAASAPEGRR